MNNRWAAITGMGVISCIGNNLNDFWSNLIAGKSGIKELKRFDTTGLRNSLMGEVTGIDFDIFSPGQDFALAAVKEALNNSGAQEGGNFDLITATNFAAAESFEEFIAAEDENGNIDLEMREYLEMSCYSNANKYLRENIDFLGTGDDYALSLSCSSGTAALGTALDLIRSGKSKRVVVVGYDSLNMLGMSGLSILRTITNENIRPFDKNRSGTIFGEGAGALIVEDLDETKKRDAKIFGTVCGYSVNNNAYHLTAPDKEGVGLIVLLERALKDAGINAADIDYVNAHGTATAYFDVTETKAIKQVVGKNTPISSIKAATGHTMGAAGAIEAIATVMALQHSILPPTLNYVTEDPECDLDYITEGARNIEKANTAISISSGIGGNNSAVVLGREGNIK